MLSTIEKGVGNYEGSLQSPDISWTFLPKLLKTRPSYLSTLPKCCIYVLLLCFFASLPVFAKGGHRAELSQILRHAGKFSKNLRGSLPKNRGAETAYRWTVFNSTKHSRCRQIGLRAVFTHPRKRSLWLRCQQNKLRWRCIANVNETVEITSLVSQGLKTFELAMASRRAALTL